MDNTYIAAYLRISDDDKDISSIKKESDSISNQRKILTDFIQSNNELSVYTIREFCDDGYSGVTLKRPAIQELLKEVQNNKVYGVIVKDFSRFGRNYIEVGDYIEQIFPLLNVRFISVLDNFDSFQHNQITGSIEVGFKALIHDLYSKDLSKKIKSVKQIHQKAGIYSGGGIPFGYLENEKGSKEFCIDVDIAPIIIEIFERVAGGQTTGKVAEELNKLNIPTPGVYKRKKGRTNYKLSNPKSNLWSASQVKVILENEVYTGTYVCHKAAMTQINGIKKLEAKEYLRFENSHPAIITKELFNAANKRRIQTRTRTIYSSDKSSFLLKGKVKCGYCGYSMNRIMKVKKPYFTCRMGSSCEKDVSIGVDRLENIVQKVIENYIQLYAEAEAEEKKIERYQVQIKKSIEDKKRLQYKIKSLNVKKIQLYKTYKDNYIDKYTYLERKKDVTEKLLKHIESLQIVEDKIEKLNLPNKIDLKVLDDKEKIELIKKLIGRIEVYDTKRVEIKWKVQK